MTPTDKLREMLAERHISFYVNDSDYGLFKHKQTKVYTDKNLYVSCIEMRFANCREDYAAHLGDDGLEVAFIKDGKFMHDPEPWDVGELVEYLSSVTSW